jgi:hypothetical protein
MISTFRNRRIMAALSTNVSSTPWWLSGGIPVANCIAAYQPKGAASLAASYVNLANPGTYNAAPGVAPTWDAVNGWIFGGTQYLKTGIAPSLTYSMFIQFSGFPGGTPDRTIAGVYQGASVNFLIQPVKNITLRGYYNGGYYSLAGNYLSGNIGISGKTAYYNGSFDATIPAGGSNPTKEIYIGALNLVDSVTQIITGNIQAFVIYNITVNPTQAGLITTAMAAL